MAIALTIKDGGGTDRRIRYLWIKDGGGVDRFMKKLWIKDGGGTDRLVFMTPPTSVSAQWLDPVVRVSWTTQINTQHKIYRNGSFRGTAGVGNTSWDDFGVTSGSYTYTVRTYDGTNESADSNGAPVTVP